MPDAAYVRAWRPLTCIPLDLQSRVITTFVTLADNSTPALGPCNVRITPFAVLQLHPADAERKKALVFGWRTEAHHIFDAGAVVPATVEDDDLTGSGEMLHVTLQK